MADPKIKYDIEAAVKGEADINALAQRLEDMGKILDADLSPAAKEAAAEMRSLGSQQAAIVVFAKLSEQVKASENDLSRAKSSVKSFNTEIAASGPPTAEQAAMLAKLNGQVEANTQKLDDQKQAMQAAGKELTAYGLTGDRIIEAQRQTSASFVSLKNSIEDTIPGMRLAGNAGEEAAAKINGAWGTLGVRSFTQTQAEIAKIKTALDVVKASGASPVEIKLATESAQAKIKELERELRAANDQLTLGDKAARLFSGSIAQISAGNIVANGVGYLTGKVQELGSAFIASIVQGDQLSRGLKAVYDDAALAAQQIEFLKKSSSESGISFSALGGEFVKFSASMKSANIPLEQSNNLFKAVTAATAALGLDAETTAGTLNALGQMASKGTVSMEELRGQLGDRLPGAIGLTASGLGLAEAQLIKLVESGNLATRDFIVPFTQALGKLKGETDGITPSWERFKGLLSEMAQGAGDSGWALVLSGSIKVLGGTVAVLGLGLNTVSEAFLLIIKGAAAMAVALTSPTQALNLMKDATDGATKRLTAQAVSLQNLVAPSAQAANASSQVTEAMAASTAAAVKAINANTALSAEQKLTALSTTLAGNATMDASAKMVQYNVAAAELIKGQSSQTEAYAKLAKATKEQGDTLVAMAKLTGDETAILQANTQAAQLNADALDKVAKSQAAETAMLVAQKTEIEANAKARGLTALQIKTEVDALDDLIKKSEADTEQSRQSAQAAHAQLLERQLLTQALKDHTGQIDELKKAMNEAEVALKEYERLQIEGKKTEEEVKAKREALTAATALYNDALNDTVKSLQTKQIADKAAASATEIGLNAQKSYYKAMEDGAKAVGDYGTALYANIEQKKIDIKLIEAKVAAMKAEAEGNIAVAKAELAVLDASGKIDPVKRAQIEASIKVAEAKKLEADAMGLSTKGIELQITALRDGTQQLDGFKKSTDSATGSQGGFASSSDAATSALERQNAELERTISAQEKANELKDRANALERERLNIDKEGFSIDPVTKQRVNMGESQSSANQRVSQRYGDGMVGNADAIAATELARKINEARSNPIGVTPGANAEITAMLAELGRLEAVIQAAKNKSDTPQNQNNSNVAVQQPAAIPQQATKPSTIPEPSKTYTVNLNINGQNTPINVASPTDAQNFIAALQRAKLSA